MKQLRDKLAHWIAIEIDDQFAPHRWAAPGIGHGTSTAEFVERIVGAAPDCPRHRDGFWPGCAGTAPAIAAPCPGGGPRHVKSPYVGKPVRLHRAVRNPEQNLFRSRPWSHRAARPRASALMSVGHRPVRHQERGARVRSIRVDDAIEPEAKARGAGVTVSIEIRTLGAADTLYPFTDGDRGDRLGGRLHMSDQV